jgi:hypothetical protein
MSKYRVECQVIVEVDIPISSPDITDGDVIEAVEDELAGMELVAVNNLSEVPS